MIRKFGRIGEYLERKNKIISLKKFQFVNINNVKHVFDLAPYSDLFPICE